MGLKLSPPVHSWAESSLKLMSMGHASESLRITGYVNLAQCNKSLEVNSGNPYATDFIFITSLDQLLLSRVFPTGESSQTLWFSFTRLRYSQWVLGYLLIALQTHQCQLTSLSGCQSCVTSDTHTHDGNSFLWLLFLTSLICPIHHLNSTSWHSKQSQKATDQ